MSEDLWLPVPSPAAVRRFQKIARSELGLELSDADALEAATQVLHVQYLKEHVVPRMARPAVKEEAGEKAAVAPKPKPKIGRPRKAIIWPVVAAPVAPASVDASALAPGESATLYAAPEE